MSRKKKFYVLVKSILKNVNILMSNIMSYFMHN